MAPDVIQKCETAAISMRKTVLQLANKGGANGAHIGPALSIIEILAVLYLKVMRHGTPDGWDRDIFLLSKGHGALAYYAALYEAGIISKEQLYTFEVNGSFFPGQPSKNRALGIDYSGGSLGLGLAYGAGLALGNRMANTPHKVYVLMGDGELNEGTVWESAQLASHNRLDELVAVIDNNAMQSDGRCCDIIELDIPALWQAHGWNTVLCDGHDVNAIVQAFEQEKPSGRPTAIIARTVKGKGISFIEHNKDWHHNRLSDKQLADALAELDIGAQ